MSTDAAPLTNIQAIAADRDERSRSSASTGLLSSVLVGAVIAAGIAALLSLLLVALGLTMADAAAPDGLAAVLRGTAFVTPLVLLFAVYVGAWTASRLHASNRRRGILCGFVFWVTCAAVSAAFSYWIAATVKRTDLLPVTGASAFLGAALCFAAVALGVSLMAGCAGVRRRPVNTSASEFPRDLEPAA